MCIKQDPVFIVSLKKLLLSSCFFISVILTKAQLNPYQYSIQKKAEGSNGAVVSAHPLASKAGIEILKKGGNAFDAAITTQLVLAVVYPGAGNLGGGGFLIGYTSEQKKIALDYREKAPGKATRDMYLDAGGKAQTNKSQNGHLAAGVPGTIAGLFATHRFGRLPFQELIQPAIELAEKGFVLTNSEANSLNHAQDDFRKYNTILPVFVRSGGWKAGDTLIQTDLARTLKRIQQKGAKGFYTGTTARYIRQEMKRGKGILSKRDLRHYDAVERTVMTSTYRDHTILGMPLPSSGGLLVQQMLGMTSGYPIAEYGFQSSATVQLMIEIERRAYADRAEFMGDADFVQVPVDKLTSPEYLKKRMSDYSPGKAGNSQATTHGTIPAESEETTHLSVFDHWGNAVSVTTTLNNHYGSKTVVGKAGFLLNNEMDDFSIKPGVPNLYGAVGSSANAIAPHKRMLSSMSPTIVLKDNKPYLIIGTPGGTTIPTQIYQSVLNLIDFKHTLEDVINLPKFHHQWLPDIVFTEADFPSDVINQLKQMGYQIDIRGHIGRTEGILIENNRIIAVGDKRGEDHAEAY